MNVEPYLFFYGRCEEALQFYSQTLGAQIGYLMRFREAPESERGPQEWQDKVMHATLRVGSSQLMASDGMHQQAPAPFGGLSLTLNVECVEQAERLFTALSEGGEVRMPPAQTFWSPCFAMLNDRFGVAWMINCAPKTSG
ncbi:MAG: VOC family protein [Pseudomonadota bacterium]